MGTRLRSLDSADGRRGLLEWAEPVIYDRLRDAYQRRLGAGDDALRLARLHCRVWRALIAGDEANYEGLRTELVAAATRSGLEVACLGRGDAETMAELLDIVVMRFQRSRAPGVELSPGAVRTRRTAGRSARRRVTAARQLRVITAPQYAPSGALRAVWAVPRMPPSSRSGASPARSGRERSSLVQEEEGVVEFRR